MEWQPYDPAWLVALAREAMPDAPWLADALATCTRASQESRAYLYFADPSGANEPGSGWQLAENVVLHHPREGDLVLDVLKDGRIGGVEFLSRL